MLLYECHGIDKHHNFYRKHQHGMFGNDNTMQSASGIRADTRT